MLRFFSLCALFMLQVPLAAYAESATVKIGYLLDLSGKAAFIGQQSQAGAELAVRELAARGKKIEIVYEDHRTEPRTSVAGAKKLLSLDRVDAVLCDTTPACVAASPIVAEAKRVFMYQAPAVSILQSNPYAFKNFLDYEQGCRRVASYWKTHGIKKVVNLKINSEFGELCARGAGEVFPSQETFTYDSGNDLRSLLLRAKESGASAILQTGYEGDYISHFKAAADLEYVAPTGMPEPLLTKTVLQAVSEKAVEGSVLFGFRGVSEGFIERLKKAGLFRSESNLQSAAIAYLHVLQVVAAVEVCPDRSVDCESAHIGSSSSDEVLGFKGWANRIASYDYVLHTVHHGQLLKLEEASDRSYGR